MRPAWRHFLWGLLLLLVLPVMGPHGVPVGPGALAAAAPSCDRFTIEQIPLGATRAELEALPLGKLEIVGQTSEEIRYLVRRSKHAQHIHVLLRRGRVENVFAHQNADAAASAAVLKDLTSRWGEPDKLADADKTGKSPDRVHASTQRRWSDRGCPAYAAYLSDARGLFVLLSAGPILDIDPDRDLPEIAR